MLKIQFDVANKIRDSYGDKPCDHPELAKEYYRGAQTQDKICIQCGRVVSGGKY